MGGPCLRGTIVYRAAVIANNKTEFYTGIAGNSFKGRWDGHKCTIKYSKLRDKTTLSQHIWNLKDKKIEYKTKWEILHRTKGKPNSKYGCSIHILGRIEIAKSDRRRSLNRRTELQAKCTHLRGCYF